MRKNLYFYFKFEQHILKNSAIEFYHLNYYLFCKNFDLCIYLLVLNKYFNIYLFYDKFFNKFLC